MDWERGIFLGGMGTIFKGCFLGGMGDISLVVFQGRKVGGFFFSQGILSLVMWDGWLEKGVGIMFFIFFHNMET